MGLSHKGLKDTVFVIFDKGVRKASVLGTNSNIRGVVTGKSVRIYEKGAPHPIQSDVLKRNIFVDEEVANKTFFTRSLKGEYSE